MIVLLNGPLGIGKSTLAELLAERLEWCVMLNGDSLAATHPPAADAVAQLHSTIALLVAHHRRFGYRHFVVDHLWRSVGELDDLSRRLLEVDGDATIRAVLLTLPIDRRQTWWPRCCGVSGWVEEVPMNARSFLTVTAVLEGATGLALLAMPSGTVTLLLGHGLETPRETVVARLAGTAVVAIAVMCGAASRNLPNEQRSVLVGLLVYNLSVPVLLIASALQAGLQAPGVWVASLGHAVLLARCLACLRVR